METAVQAGPEAHVARATVSVYGEPDAGVTLMSWTTTVNAVAAATVNEYVCSVPDDPASAR